MYQYYPAGSNGPNLNNCPTCTSQSGIRYPYSGYALPSPTTDAAGLPLTPLILKLQEVEEAVATGGTINHALRLTLPLGYCASSKIWPATTFATDGGTIPFGARFRLKSSFNISGFSAIAQILLKQLQQYGVILADGGYGWQTDVEYTRWPKAIMDAMQSINHAGITASTFEAVDESSLEISPSSGLTTQNRETVTYTSSTGTVSVDIALQGPVVNMKNDVQYIQAGTPQQQLIAYNNFGGVTWSMNPALGTLTNSGLYTPPASQSGVSSTTVTATSSLDSSVLATMTLVVYPNTNANLAIYLAPGLSSNYTDTSGNVWLAGPLAGGDAGCNPGTESCFGYGNGGSWPNVANIALYKTPIYAGNDLRFDITVPNGTYQITAKLANNSGSNSSQGNMVLETQGSDGSVLDLWSVVGNNQPYDVTSTATVTNNLLSFVLRGVNTTGNNVAPFISAIQIVQTGP
jgi:hypothetical protein